MLLQNVADVAPYAFRLIQQMHFQSFPCAAQTFILDFQRFFPHNRTFICQIALYLFVAARIASQDQPNNHGFFIAVFLPLQKPVRLFF